MESKAKPDSGFRHTASPRPAGAPPHLGQCFPKLDPQGTPGNLPEPWGLEHTAAWSCFLTRVLRLRCAGGRLTLTTQNRGPSVASLPAYGGGGEGRQFHLRSENPGSAQKDPSVRRPSPNSPLLPSPGIADLPPPSSPRGPRMHSISECFILMDNLQMGSSMENGAPFVLLQTWGRPDVWLRARPQRLVCSFASKRTEGGLVPGLH